MTIIPNNAPPKKVNYAIQGNFYEGAGDDINTAAEDPLAKAVLERTRRAVIYKQTAPVYQNKSHEALLTEAYQQVHKMYSSSEAAALQLEFGLDTPPIKYYDLAAQKTKALQFWLSNLVLTNIDSMFTVNPTSSPTLDASSTRRINNEVTRRLLLKLQASGISDSELLLDERGLPTRELQEYLDIEAANVIQSERDIVMGTAQSAADNIKSYMKDITEEGGYALNYNLMLFDCTVYGVGYMRAPVMRSKPTRVFKGDTVTIVNKVVPCFQYVNAFSMYPICDANTLQENTANIEYRFINRMELLRLRDTPEYDKTAIDFILNTVTEQSSEWLGYAGFTRTFAGMSTPYNRQVTGRPFKGIAVLIHEGFFKGGDLTKSGLTGLDDNAIYNARVEVCCNRTIRRELVKLPGGIERTYFSAPLQKVGEGLFDNIGLPALLIDSERSINRMMYNIQSNMDWSSRPPFAYTEQAFEYGDMGISELRPGGSIKMNNLAGLPGSTIKPIQQLEVVKPHYTMLEGMRTATIKLADDACQLPGFVTGSVGYGQATLGEYSQRVTNSSRFVQNVALYQDVFFIRPLYENLYYYVLEKNPELARGADIYPFIQGVSGLISKDMADKLMSEIQTFIIQNPNGVYPSEMVNYAAREIAKSGGVPVDALGMGDPVLDAVSSNARAAIGDKMAPATPQAPALDGRSAPAIPNSMSPNGVPAGAIQPDLSNGGN